MQTDYKGFLEQAKKDLIAEQAKLGECLREQGFIEAKIVGLRQTVVALSKMLGEEFVEEDAMGLTDAIRHAFRNAEGLTALEVRKALEDLGYDISKYGNFMASVHSVINRLLASGEIRKSAMRGGGGPSDGKPVYSWGVSSKSKAGQRISPVEALLRARISEMGGTDLPPAPPDIERILGDRKLAEDIEKRRKK